MKISDLNNINLTLNNDKKPSSKENGLDFAKTLNTAIDELNQTQVKADKAVADLATGEITDIHQAAAAINKAEISMKLMLEIRNKAISAYKEISRTQL